MIRVAVCPQLPTECNELSTPSAAGRYEERRQPKDLLLDN